MSHSAPGNPSRASSRRTGDGLVGSVYSPAEWRLLTQLPGRVAAAATPVDPRRPVRGVLAGLAGLDGIAAGRSFDSELVRAVVAAIYAEPDHGSGSGRDGVPDAAAVTGPTDLFAACRAATRLLAERADPADSAAYRQWVQTVAARVGRAVRDRPDGPFGPPPTGPGGSPGRAGRPERGSAATGSMAGKQWFMPDRTTASRVTARSEEAARLAFLAELGRALGLTGRP
nr:hypothetical protein [Micromonospora sp. DSM 115978]